MDEISGDDIRPLPAEELDDGEPTGDSVMDRLRAMPVGTNDPMIVGDAGPLDVPPASDGPDALADGGGATGDLDGVTTGPGEASTSP